MLGDRTGSPAPWNSPRTSAAGLRTEVQWQTLSTGPDAPATDGRAMLWSKALGGILALIPVGIVMTLIGRATLESIGDGRLLSESSIPRRISSQD